jgi:hypothetical protein
MKMKISKGERTKNSHKNKKNISSLYKIQNLKEGDRQTKVKHMSLRENEENQKSDDNI